jgi:hypothetical protein
MRKRSKDLAEMLVNDEDLKAVTGRYEDYQSGAGQEWQLAKSTQASFGQTNDTSDQKHEHSDDEEAAGYVDAISY